MQAFCYRSGVSAALEPQVEGEEDPAFLRTQLATYIGNKRALVQTIGEAVRRVRERLGGRRIDVWEPFSGSGAVSRLLKQHARRLWVSDLHAYAAAIGRSYLPNRGDVDRAELDGWVDEANRQAEALEPDGPLGFIERMYAPADEGAIVASDRVFYTRNNARRLDFYRQRIETAPSELRPFLLGPLLAKASVHANTAGVFKGFYKDRATGVGRFGGSGADALGRIRGRIQLEAPVVSRFEGEWHVAQGDANQLVEGMPGVDLVYLDPPYNQHPYGSNYFMLDLLTAYVRPTRVSRVSGIPADWTRSGYNQRARSMALLMDLVDRVDAPFVLLSFSDDGFISPARMDAGLEARGKLSRVELRHPTFRGSRNLSSRRLHVTERLLLLER